jgi:hypothetical protein
MIRIMKKLDRFSALVGGAFCFVFLASASVIEPIIGGEKNNEGNNESAVQLSISELMNNPRAFIDEYVELVGVVGDVCPMMGCWADLSESGGTETIRFKVPDGQLVFTAAMRDSEVRVEGFFREHVLDEKQARSWLQHLADEKGEPFSPDSHSGPLSFFQIEGDEAELLSSIYSLKQS